MSNTLSIAFTGDIGFDQYMDGKWEDEDLISDEIQEFLHDSDHVIVDVEAALIEAQNNDDKGKIAQFVHNNNQGTVKVLDKLGADIWNICNNHIMDYGQPGLEITLEIAKQAGVQTIGAGKNLGDASSVIYFDDAGGIGIFAVGYYNGCIGATQDEGGCLNWRETGIIRENINKIKEQCRYCIIVFHGGEEFAALPVPYTRNRLISFLDMGADIIVCHHPHVPMNYEKFGDKAIFYSLGNFIYDTPYQRSQYNTDTGVLLKIHLNENGYTFEAMGTKLDRESERVGKGPLPDIFCEVNAEEYNKLIPLASKMFLSVTKRLHKQVSPEKWTNATEGEWVESFLDPNRRFRIEGELQDLIYIYNLAQKEQEGAWKESRLDKVKEYILRQM